MLIAISSSENSLNSTVDLRFGRTKGFIIYDTDKESFEYINNVQNLQAVQGAGIQAAQNVVNKDVKAVITGHCGPKAFKVLKTYDIKVYTSDQIKIEEAIKKFKENKLTEITTADVEGHWV